MAVPSQTRDEAIWTKQFRVAYTATSILSFSKKILPFKMMPCNGKMLARRQGIGVSVGALPFWLRCTQLHLVGGIYNEQHPVFRRGGYDRHGGSTAFSKVTACPTTNQPQLTGK
jgi:hypothetical protein